MPLLTPPPTPAIQRGDRSTFANRLDAFITWLINFVTEMLALVSGLNTLAAGGAYAIPYTVDLSSAADADPTSGKLRFNAANQNTATMLFADLIGTDAVDYTTILDQFDASTSVVKGQLRIVKQGDPSKFLTFDVTARTTVAGYRKLAVTNTGGSSANPFGANDPVLVKFTRSGDKGDAGSMTQVLWVRDEKGSAAPGGPSTGGFASDIRTLNTVKRNTISGASLSGNVITLPAGTYRLSASAPAFGVNGHRMRIQYTSNATTLEITGSSEYSTSGAASSSTIVNCEFTVSATATLTVLHMTAQNVGNQALGQLTGDGSGPNVYTEVFIEKVS